MSCLYVEQTQLIALHFFHAALEDCSVESHFLPQNFHQNKAFYINHVMFQFRITDLDNSVVAQFCLGSFWTTVGLNVVHFRCKTEMMHGIYFKYSVMQLVVYLDRCRLQSDFVKSHCCSVITAHVNVLTAVVSCTDLPQTEHFFKA